MHNNATGSELEMLEEGKAGEQSALVFLSAR